MHGVEEQACGYPFLDRSLVPVRQPRINVTSNEAADGRVCGDIVAPKRACCTLLQYVRTVIEAAGSASQR